MGKANNFQSAAKPKNKSPKAKHNHVV